MENSKLENILTFLQDVPTNSFLPIEKYLYETNNSVNDKLKTLED